MTLNEIKENEISCVIQVESEDEVVALSKMLPFSSHHSTTDILIKNYKKALNPEEMPSYDGTVCFTITSGRIGSFCPRSFYETHPSYGTIYKFKDLVQSGGIIERFHLNEAVYNSTYGGGTIIRITETRNDIYYTVAFDKGVLATMKPIQLVRIHPQTTALNTDVELVFNKDQADKFAEEISKVLIKHGAKPIKKENDNMSKDAINFIFTKGERTAIVTDTIEHKNGKNETVLEKKTRAVNIPTIKTTVYTFNGVASTTCDEEDFNERTGCLVASAKLIASKSEEANLMYQIAIKTWGSETSTIILETLADRAACGDFNKRYSNWKKIKIVYDKEQRTCKLCGKTFETIEECIAHEKWHEDNKKAKKQRWIERRIERKEAAKRIANMEREGRIEQYMKEITKENNNVTGR